MARLKLDENLGKRGAALLRGAGHDVATIAGQELQSATDTAVITACKAEGRCLVTLDHDFANPLRFRPSDYAGIAVLRLPTSPSPQDLQDALRTLIGALALRDVHGKLWIIRRGRIREYQPDDEPESSA